MSRPVREPEGARTDWTGRPAVGKRNPSIVTGAGNRRQRGGVGPPAPLAPRGRGGGREGEALAGTTPSPPPPLPRGARGEKRRFQCPCLCGGLKVSSALAHPGSESPILLGI